MLSTPTPALAEGSDGNFYGLLPEYGTGGEGVIGEGAVYRVTPAGVVTIVHPFFGTDGEKPLGGLVAGSGGTLYGTASAGGITLGYGSVFTLTTAGAFAVVHNFTGPDGSQLVYGLTDGGNGSLYGTTTTGGAYGKGVFFAVTPSGDFTSLYDFSGAQSDDGANPSSALVLGSDGYFYGTTGAFGTSTGGIIYQATKGGQVNNAYNLRPVETDANNAATTGGIIQARDGNFYVTNAALDDSEDGSGDIYRFKPTGNLTFLTSFESIADADSNLSGPLAEGADGNFYGTAMYGGEFGAVFRLTPAGKITNVHTFAYSDGARPYGGLVAGADGKFYGMTGIGGAKQHGTFFSVTTGGELTTLHDFAATGDDFAPEGLIPGLDGNFYGTTHAGGANAQGTFLSLTPAGVPTVLYHFNGTDGANPVGRLVEGADGNFYGVTADAQNGYGTVFQINLHGIVAFYAGSYTVNENAGSATLTVHRTGSTAGAITVKYATADGTAVAGTDYTAKAGTLTWADGDATSRTMVVPFADRGISDGSTRTFRVVLTPATGGAAPGDPTVAEVNILENDLPPVVSAALVGDGRAQYGVKKGKVIVRRTGDASGPLTVSYRVKGSAKAGVDFKALPGQLVIPAGSAQAKIKIKPLNDPLNPGRLKAKIVLQPPVGNRSYAVGDPKTAKVVVLAAEK